MSIESELARIQQAKADIIQAIIAKGVDVPEVVKVEDLTDYIRSIPIEPPEPPIDYTLLVNWADENTPSPDPNYANVITDYLEGMNDPEDTTFYDLEHNYFVNTVQGELLEDSRKPVDFSKYGKTGTPFALQCSGDIDPDSFETKYSITMPSNLIFTAELWYAASPYTLDNDRDLGLISIGNNSWEDEPWSWLEFSSWNDYSTGKSSFKLNSSEDAEASFGEGITDTNWHHYAISCNGSNLYLFIDGKLCTTCILTEKDKTQIAAARFLYIQGMNSSCNTGRIAQIAFCPICKWTTDFQVPTTAY